jgi:chitodextrinase
VYYHLRFQVVSQGATTVNLAKFRTSSNGSIGGLILTSGGNLGFRNDVSATTTNSGLSVTRGVWHEAVIHLVVNSPGGDVDVWLDGTPVAGLTNLSQDTGTNAVAKVQLGENTTGRTFDVAFDDVAVTSPSTVDTLAPSVPTGVAATSPNSHEIDLAWNASTDDVGVVGYRVFRNAQPVATVLAPATTYADTTAVFGTSYTYTVEAYDAAGNTSLPSVPISATSKDTTPPTAPSSLVASGLSDTSIRLTWSGSTDDIGVTGYTVSRDGTVVATLPATTLTYTDTGLAPNTPHSYSVVAFDAAGNSSTASLASASTLPDRTPPTAPANLAGTAVSKAINLTWTASTDDVAVTGYRVFRGGVKLADVSATTLAYSDTTVADVTSYTYTVEAFDAAGNLSPASNAVTVKSLDSTPPTAPTSLHTTSVSSTKVSLAWTASTDNVGVTAYNVYRNGTKLGSVTGTTLSYNDTTVAQGGVYSYTVTASDAAGNESAASNAVPVSIGDTTPPTAPTGLAGTAVPGAINLTWTAATDNVAVTGYRIFRNSTQIAQIGALTTYSDTTVASATAYTYFVRAIDAAGNVSSNSNQISITSADTTAPSVPTGLATTQITASAVSLTWTAATDNVAVTKYSVFRDGVKLADVNAPTVTFTDSTVTPQTSYSYTVTASDAAANQSAPSTALPIRVPLFGDGFEAGNLNLWTTSAGLTVGTQRASSGTHSVEGNTRNGNTFAAKTLTTAQTNLYLTARVFLQSNKQGLDLLRVATAANGNLVRLSLNTNRQLTYTNGVTGTTTSSTTSMSTGAWHTVELHVSINGTSSLVEVWFDGTKVTALSKTDSLGTTPIGRVEIGQSTAGGTYDVFFDDVRTDNVQ